MDDFDVVIVGGRVAGASTAMLLARAGVRVALLDRGRYGSDTLSTHGLMRAGVLQLARWGLLPTVVAAGTPPVRRSMFHYADGESSRCPPGQRRRRGPVRPTPHAAGPILVDAAAAAGAEVLHETVVTELLCRDDRVAGVRARDRTGRLVPLRAGITVGADGARSTVASLTRAPFVQQGRAVGAVLYRYFADLPTVGYEWAYGDGVAAGLIPTDDGLTCVFVGTSTARMRGVRPAGAAEAFATLLGQASSTLFARVSAAVPEERLRGWPGMPGYLRRCWGPGWALVGDAGYYKDPITTHGITAGLRDAELLANAVLDSLGGSVPEHVALSGYQVARDRLSGPLFSATEAVAAYDWDTVAVRTLLRQVSSAMGHELELFPELVGSV